MVQEDYPPKDEYFEVFRRKYVDFFRIEIESSLAEQFSPKLLMGKFAL